jgi:subtilisin-like proprotein convertase family protein
MVQVCLPVLLREYPPGDGAKVSQTGGTAWSTVAVAPFIYNNSTQWKADAINTPVVGAVIQNPAGFVSASTSFTDLYTTPASTTGNWTLAMCDGGPGDVGALASWTLTIDYTTPGSGGANNSYLWSPAAGLYNDAGAGSPYIGANTPVVYAAPTVFTVYTVTATDNVTGCVNTAQAFVNYTPPAPSVTPSSVAMCLGDPAVRLISSSSTTSTLPQICSGPISVIVPDNLPSGATSNLTVSGVPAGCNISNMSVTFNMNHTWDGDVAIALKAPNGQILNLDYYLSTTGGTGATTGFVNTKISSAGTAALSSGSGTYTGTFKADGVITNAFGGAGGPTGFTPTVTTWPPLYTIPNGVWTLAMKDGFGGDQGTLTSWCIDITYVCGVQATAATWSPVGGLFNDAVGTPYTGTPRDTVWTRPTPSGVYTYQVTVQSVPVPPLAFTNTAPIIINAVGTATPSPANLIVSGLPTTGVTVKNVNINGLSHTWAGDVNIVLQSPGGQNVILMANSNADPLIALNNVNLTFSDAATASIPAATAIPSGTYLPTNRNGATFAFLAPGPTVTGPTFPASPTLSTFTGNVNGTWKLFVEDRVAGDQGSISGGFSVGFDLGIAACTSPPRTVVVTVNQPATLNAALPADQTVCTDKVATFTAAPTAGTGPFTYQWQVSTDNGNTFTNITNVGVYSGATTATLTITAPPLAMNLYQYRAVVNGAAPCAAVISRKATLRVNPLPTIFLTASPYSSLFPGLTATISAAVTPFAGQTFVWLRNGVVLNNPAVGVVSGLGTSSLVVNVDGLGVYTLRVTDINLCTNLSQNSITIKDSASGKCFIYPNPTSGNFEVRYYSTANDVVPRALTVYDAKGDRVFTKLYPIGRPYDRMPVDMRAYGKGLYWVEVTDVNGNRLTMCRVAIQ